MARFHNDSGRGEEKLKIYTDDPLVSYKGTTISADRTRHEIDAKLREYGVADIHWHWKPEVNDVYVQFGIEEVIDGIPVKIAAKVVCPKIWSKAKSRSPKTENRHEQVNLQISMRVMWWYIKTHLESAYAMQSSRVAGFLADMITPSGERCFDVVKKRLDRLPTLEYKDSPPPREVKLIVQEKESE